MRSITEIDDTNQPENDLDEITVYNRSLNSWQPLKTGHQNTTRFSVGHRKRLQNFTDYSMSTILCDKYAQRMLIHDQKGTYVIGNFV